MPRKSWWARLPFGVRMTAGVSAVLMVIGGGTAAIAQLTEEEPRIVTPAGANRGVVPPPAPAGPDKAAAAPGRAPVVKQGQQEQPEQHVPQAAEPVRRAEPVKPPATDTPAAEAKAPPAATKETRTEPQPQVTTRTESERRAIPFRTRLVRDPSLPRGSKRVQTEGVPGEELVRYAVTLTDGRPTERRMIDTQVTRQPQHRVVAFGTGRGNNCRDDRCGPGWRTADCERTTESAEDPLTIEDLKAVELQPGMLC
ncbi:G5 domain-containing protein [Actinoplanes sp. NPDC049265]|uniref:G5 domain-containing protein n=1 Tax=Actinoplanes sp. NPDC049265 TaxID=3363902 RepID=UPI00371CE1BA